MVVYPLLCICGQPNPRDSIRCISCNRSLRDALDLSQMPEYIKCKEWMEIYGKKGGKTNA